jgi:uncharacterized repeat protein (TIGR01451 family)
MDQAGASVTVVASPVVVTINEIYQLNDPNPHITDPLQTGKPTFVRFTVRNQSSAAITGATFQVQVNNAGTYQPVTCQGAPTLPDPLAAGASQEITCQYTPPAGAAANTTLTPEVHVVVTGTGIATPVTAAQQVNFVDLLLGLNLNINPNTATPGDQVTFTLELTNEGASPIGCNAADDTLPCHITPDFGGNTILDTLFGIDFDTIFDTVLAPGATRSWPRQRTITATDPTDYALTVQGGFWSQPIQDASLLGYYTTQTTAEGTLNIGDEAGLAVENLDVYQIDTASGNAHLTLLQTGKVTHVTFDLRNTGNLDITGLNYTVAIGGEPLDPVCQHVGEALPDPFEPDDTVEVECRFSPPPGAENNPILTPELSVIARGNGGDARDTARTDLELVDLQINIQLGLDPTEVTAGDTLTYTVVLENEGASPIGCDIDVEPGLPCHLSLLTGTDTVLRDALLGLQDDVANTVLLPAGELGDTASFTATRTIQADEESVTYTLGVDGGYWTEDLETAGQLGYYIAHDEDTADLTVSSGDLVLNIVATPNPPVMGSNITYTITLRNETGSTVTDLVANWQISPVAANTNGYMLLSNPVRAQTTSGQITLRPTAIAAGGTLTGILAKTEDQTRSYVFMVTVVGTGLNGQVTASANITLAPTGVVTPTPTGTLWPSLPQMPTPSSNFKSLPTIERCFNASGPFPMSDAPRNGRVNLPSSIRYDSVAEKTKLPDVMSTWPPPKLAQ